MSFFVATYKRTRLCTPIPRGPEPSDEGWIDLYCNGALQQRDRDHKTVYSSYFDKRSVQSPQGPSLNLYTFAGSQEGPWLTGKAGGNHGAYRVDLSLIYRNRSTVVPDDLNDSRRRQDWQPILNIQSAEQIARK
jgi:hypothetical protein